jgi:hypothetical protein
MPPADTAPAIRRRRRFSFAATLVLGLFAEEARGQPAPPVCDPETVGQAACFTAKLCLCVFDRGGSVSGLPPSFRWDCGINRPACGEAANPPVTIQEHRGQAPFFPAPLVIERR